MTRPLALDLFCGGGGVAEGLIAAGFDVVGVDIDRRCARPYPGWFIHGDALHPPMRLDSFDLVWASPPCQAYSVATPTAARTDAPRLVEAVRALFAGHRWTCIENVPGAPLRTNLVLTGPMVGLHRIYRRRHFELSWLAGQPPIEPLAAGVMASGRGLSISTSLSNSNHFYPRKRAGLRGRVSPAEAGEAMGITTPMTGRQVGEAIPPAMAEWIGASMLQQRQALS